MMKSVKYGIYISNEHFTINLFKKLSYNSLNRYVQIKI